MYRLTIIKTPTGKFIFVGRVPIDLSKCIFNNYQEAEESLFKYMKENNFYYSPKNSFKDNLAFELLEELPF